MNFKGERARKKKLREGKEGRGAEGDWTRSRAFQFPDLGSYEISSKSDVW